MVDVSWPNAWLDLIRVVLKGERLEMVQKKLQGARNADDRNNCRAGAFEGLGIRDTTYLTQDSHAKNGFLTVRMPKEWR